MTPYPAIPDFTTTCASCGWRVEDDAPVYRAGDRVAHVRCPFPTVDHAFASATHVGQLLYGMNPPAPAGGALWACRCGAAFAATTDDRAKMALARHLHEAA